MKALVVDDDRNTVEVIRKAISWESLGIDRVFFSYEIETAKKILEKEGREGIIPVIDSVHTIAHTIKIATVMEKGQIIVITISGRGGKDCASITRYRKGDIYE